MSNKITIVFELDSSKVSDVIKNYCLTHDLDLQLFISYALSCDSAAVNAPCKDLVYMLNTHPAFKQTIYDILTLKKES